MTQIPRDRAAGAEEPASAALTLADILNALALGARKSICSLPIYPYTF